MNRRNETYAIQPSPTIDVLEYKSKNFQTEKLLIDIHGGGENFIE